METEKITLNMKEADWANIKVLLDMNAKEAELDPTDKTICKYIIIVKKEKVNE